MVFFCQPQGAPELSVRHLLPSSYNSFLLEENALFDQTTEMIFQCSFICDQAPPGLFDPKLSSSSALLACSDSRCKDLIRGGYGTCRRDICEFDLRYGPLSVQYSAATGYYLSDSVGLEIFEGSTSVKTSSAPILFG